MVRVVAVPFDQRGADSSTLRMRRMLIDYLRTPHQEKYPAVRPFDSTEQVFVRTAKFPALETLVDGERYTFGLTPEVRDALMMLSVGGDAAAGRVIESDCAVTTIGHRKRGAFMWGIGGAFGTPLTSLMATTQFFKQPHPFLVSGVVAAAAVITALTVNIIVNIRIERAARMLVATAGAFFNNESNCSKVADALEKLPR